MSIKQNAYLTLEASFVLPVILFLFISIIWAALHLYNRCIASQNQYEIFFNSLKVTSMEQNSKDIIYNDKSEVEKFDQLSYFESNPIKVVREGRKNANTRY